MPTTVVPAAPHDELVLRNLAQLCAYDFAEIAGWELPDSGRFPDAIVDGCFDGGHRHAFFLRADGRLAGFAIVDMPSRLTGDDGVRDMAEIRQTAGNTAALAFWRKVVGRYTGGQFEESILDGPCWRGPVQTFVCPRAAPA